MMNVWRRLVALMPTTVAMLMALVLVAAACSGNDAASEASDDDDGIEIGDGGGDDGSGDTDSDTGGDDGGDDDDGGSTGGGTTGDVQTVWPLPPVDSAVELLPYEDYEDEFQTRLYSSNVVTGTSMAEIQAFYENYFTEQGIPFDAPFALGESMAMSVGTDDLLTSAVVQWGETPPGSGEFTITQEWSVLKEAPGSEGEADTGGGAVTSDTEVSTEAGE